jgi:uncharacterized protein (TIGR03086 family)
MDIALMKTVTEEFAAHLSEVTCGELAAATPCALWSVEDLFRHAVEENLALGRAVDPQLPPPPPREGRVPRELTFRDSARYAMDALARIVDPVDARRVPWKAFGDLSPRELFDLHLTDTLLHTWDLAKATGFDLDKPSIDVLEVALGCLRRLPPQLRGSGRPFAPIVDFPVGSEMEELLALSGRDPAWPA